MDFKKSSKSKEKSSYLLGLNRFMRISVFGLRGFPNVEGGVEKHCERLYPKMETNIDIKIYRRKPYSKNNQTTNYSKNISFLDLPSTKIKGFETVFHSYLATKKAIKDDSDVVHIHNIGPALFCRKIKKKNKKIVLTYHSPNYEHSKWGFFAKKILKMSEKRALNNADAIIFVNRFQMDKYPEKIKNKSVYIPNGIVFHERSNETSFLEKRGIGKHNYILGVGRITPEKGFDTLIKAFVSANIPNYKLVLAGGTGYEKKYASYLKSLCNENVIFVGSVNEEELNQLYSNASLFVLSSNNEGFPLVLLEAMSYGLDVAVSDIPASHLVALEEDDYFKKGDETQLSKIIKNKLVHPTKRKYDLQLFDWNLIAKRTTEIYRKVLNNESITD